MPNRSATDLTPAQAEYVLSALVEQKKISQRDIKQAVAQMHNEIADLEARLEALRAAGGGGKRGARKSRSRSRSTMTSAEAHASRQLQGRYMSLIRQFPKTKRAKYKKMAEKDGRQAAVDAMQADLK